MDHSFPIPSVDEPFWDLSLEFPEVWVTYHIPHSHTPSFTPSTRTALKLLLPSNNALWKIHNLPLIPSHHHTYVYHCSTVTVSLPLLYMTHA